VLDCIILYTYTLLEREIFLSHLYRLLTFWLFLIPYFFPLKIQK